MSKGSGTTRGTVLAATNHHGGASSNRHNGPSSRL